MKILPLLAAAAVAVVAMPLAAVPASAAKAGVATAEQIRVSIGDRGRHHRRAHWRTVCTTRWRHHHAIRVCRKVRTWN